MVDPPKLSKDLLELVNGVPDYRRTGKGNCKYTLPEMILLVLLARVCGCSTRKEIVSFGMSNLRRLQTDLGILAGGCPSEPTLCRMEMSIDGDTFASLESAFAQKFMVSCVEGEIRIIAMDGKFMRGTDTGEGRSPDVVTAFSATDGLPLDTEMCDIKSNEIKAGPKVINRAGYMRGAIVTADAMSCQTQIIDAIRAMGADYFIALKANQKAARWGVEDAIPELEPGDEWNSDWETGHGRMQRRRCRVYTDIQGLKALEKFKDVRNVVVVDTHTIEKKSGVEREEERFYISSFTGSAGIMDYISRKHWAIENNLHWTLDARMGQDATKRKDTKTARNLDIIQKIVYIIYTVGARLHLPEAIKKRKELMKVKFSAMASWAKHNLDYALTLMTL